MMRPMHKKLLIVAHIPSPNTHELCQAVKTGAQHPDVDGVDVVVRTPFEAQADDVLACDGIILGTTENLGYMSGALKDFFDRVYYPCLEETQGLPYCVYIRAGHDGTGTKNAIQNIVTGLRWRAIQEPLICRGPYDATLFPQQCRDLGTAMAAGLEAGIF